MNASSQKISLFTTSDYVALDIVNALVPRLISIGLQPVIFDTGLVRNRKPIRPAPVDIDFLVTGVIEKTLLPYLDQQDTPSEARILSYKQLATKHGLEYRRIQNINDPNLIAEISASAFVGGLSVRQYQVFERSMIEALHAKGFLWNIHGGLLPDYKGFLIPYRAIANGEKDYGWTLHDIDAGIDTGAIIDTCSLPLDAKKPVLDTYLDMVPLGAQMIAAAVARQIESVPHPDMRPNVGGGYYIYPTAQEMAAFEKQGVRYIASPKHYIDSVVSRFSVAGTKHANDLQDNMAAALGAFYQENSQQMVVRSVQPNARPLQQSQPAVA